MVLFGLRVIKRKISPSDDDGAFRGVNKTRANFFYIQYFDNLLNINQLAYIFVQTQKF